MVRRPRHPCTPFTAWAFFFCLMIGEVPLHVMMRAAVFLP